MDSNHELALLLVLAAIGMVTAAIVVISLLAVGIGLVASCIGAMVAGATRSLSLTRRYALSAPVVSSAVTAPAAAAARPPTPAPNTSPPQGEWLDSWFEGPGDAAPSRRSPRLRPERPPRRAHPLTHSLRRGVAGLLAETVVVGRRALTGPREWLQPGAARPVAPASRERPSWLFRIGSVARPSRISVRRLAPGRSTGLLRAPASFGYPGRRESKNVLPAGRVIQIPVPRLHRGDHDGRRNRPTRRAG